MALAPEGLEAQFASLAGIPMLGVNWALGTFPGWLLAAFCPASLEARCTTAAPPSRAEDGGETTCHSASIWLVVAALGAVSPVMLFALRGLLRPPASRENGATPGSLSSQQPPPSVELTGGGVGCAAHMSVRQLPT